MQVEFLKMSIISKNILLYNSMVCSGLKVGGSLEAECSTFTLSTSPFFAFSCPADFFVEQLFIQAPFFLTLRLVFIVSAHRKGRPQIGVGR